MLHHITFCYIIYYITLHYIISYLIISYRIIYRIISYMLSTLITLQYSTVSVRNIKLTLNVIIGYSITPIQYFAFTTF